MSAKLEVLDQIREFVNRRQSVADFQGWFMPFFWDLDGSGDQDVLGISRKVAGKLAEYGRDDLSAERLRLELANAIRFSQTSTEAQIRLSGSGIGGTAHHTTWRRVLAYSGRYALRLAVLSRIKYTVGIMITEIHINAFGLSDPANLDLIHQMLFHSTKSRLRGNGLLGRLRAKAGTLSSCLGPWLSRAIARCSW